MAERPFYGDPNAAPVWQKGAVLLGSLTATKPTGDPAGALIATRGFIINDPAAGTPITTEWDPAGMLVDDSPFTEGEETIDVTEHSAFGHGVYAKTYKNQAFSFEFQALQDDLVNAGLMFDASGLTETDGMVSGDEGFRDPTERFLLGVVRENSIKAQRRVSKNYCEISSISAAFNNGRTERTVTVSVYPDASGVLWTRHEWEL